MNNLLDAKRLGKLLSHARYNIGMSQDDMAAALGVSRNTVSSLEKGTAKMTIKQFFDWFSILGLNPTSYMLQYMNPDTLMDIKATDDDQKIEEALNILINELTPHQKRCVLYLLYGSYQGDPYAMLQLFVAHAHLPMSYRFSIANMIAETYKICESTDSLKDTSHVLPNMDILEKAIKAGKEAAMKKQDGYHIKEDQEVEE